MMSDFVPIPAAQFLRMSTEDQQFSIANQKIRIQEYAKNHASISPRHTRILVRAV